MALRLPVAISAPVGGVLPLTPLAGLNGTRWRAMVTGCGWGGTLAEVSAWRWIDFAGKWSRMWRFTTTRAHPFGIGTRTVMSCRWSWRSTACRR
jgi:hypothetical protein